MYSSAQLYGFVRNLEDLFKEGCSYNKLCVDGILDMLDVVKARLHWEAGRTLHSETLTRDVVKFYIIARLHFYVKGLNAGSSEK